MPGPMSAPNGNVSLTLGRPTDGQAKTGKTEKQRKKGKVKAAKNRPLRDDG